MPILHCACGKTLLVTRLFEAVKLWDWKLIEGTHDKLTGQCAECQKKEKPSCVNGA